VEGHITAPPAVRAEIHQRNVFCVGAVTQPITKDASTTISLYKETTSIELPQHKPHLYPLPDTTNPQHPTLTQDPKLTPHPPQRRSYAEVTRNPEYQNSGVNATLNNFLTEFKGLFTQLLNQNSMILSMLTTLINKTH